MAPTVKPPRVLSPIARIDLEEHVIQLTARAITLRHPKARTLVKLNIYHLSRYPDTALLAGADRLEAWIAEQ